METSRGCVIGHSPVSPHLSVMANVVIDQACRARLADFGLLTVVSDSINLFSSSTTDTHGGTLRWMSPELIAPEKFGTKTSRPTRASDCYSLGTAVYETVSESIPFHEVHHWAIYGKVAEGKHPSRGVCFTDDLWNVMEQCWMSHPDRRPSVECVLECLKTLSIGGDLGLNSLISTPTGYPDNLHVWSPLVNTSQDMSGVGLRAVPEAPLSGGTSSIVLLNNQPVNGVPWFSLCSPLRFIIPHLRRKSSPYGIEHGNWLPAPLTKDTPRVYCESFERFQTGLTG